MSKGNIVSGAEALIGKTFGNSVIQSYTGVGRMGIVYLAVQMSPRRDAALKIVAPVAAQTPEERAAFVTRFLQKSKAIAALQHPHILPVYDYGVDGGLSYFVMPYIRSGTLFDRLNREGTFALPKAANYLEQLAAALQYAHEQGIVHGDVTPSNVFLDADGRLLLSDFALTSAATERPTSQMRLLKSGITLGSLKYLSPEQVMGESIGPAADVYALAVVLYEMLTGQTPFTDTSPVGLAAQQVQAEPPAPRSLRPDIPAAAEQVILRALAKGYSDRYHSTQEMAAAFRAALGLADIPQINFPAQTQTTFPDAGISVTGALSGTPASPPAPRTGSLFHPVWQNVSPSGVEIIEPGTAGTRAITTPAVAAFANSAAPDVTKQATVFTGESTTTTRTPLPPARQRLGRKARIMRPEEEDRPAAIADAPQFDAQRASPASVRSANTDEIAPFPITPFAGGADVPVTDMPAPIPAQFDSSSAVDTPSRELPATNPGTMKLPSTLKIVQLPVAGQPGRYMTGLLPTQSTEASEEPDDSFEGKVPLTGATPALAFVSRLRAQTDALTMRQKAVAAALVVLLVLCGSGALFIARGHSSTPASKLTQATRANVPNGAATFTAQAAATASANDILTDSLSQNIHNWPIAHSGTQLYFFANGAYHIYDNANGRSAPAFLPGFDLKEPLTYSLRIDEIKGNDSSINNSFGMILFFSTQNKSGHNVVTFYSFEVVNTKAGQYQFWKYDSSKGSNPWTSLWHHSFASEFHPGQGTKNTNIFTIGSSKGNFTFLVNGEKVGTLHDSSFSSGEIGMLVNLKGTEVAFSNLQLTYNL